MVEPWQQTLIDILRTIAAILFAYVGHHLSKRDVTPDARFALRGFVLWWYGLALTNVLGIAFGLYSSAVTPGLGLMLTNLLVTVGIIFLISFGLLVYLLYLYTGHRMVRHFLAGFYGLFFIAIIVWVFVQDPFVAVDEVGDAVIDYRDPLPQWTGSALGILLVFPLLAGATAYALLYFRVETRTQKYRIFLVSAAFILWFGSSFINTLLGTGGDEAEPTAWWPIVSQLIGLLAALMVLFAYRPPTWLQRRFHVAAVLAED